MSFILKKQTESILQFYTNIMDQTSYVSCIRCSNVIFATLLMKNKDIKKSYQNFNEFQENFNSELVKIKLNFPNLYKSFLELKKILPTSQQEILIKEHIKALDFDSDHKDDFIAWFYQYCKLKREKQVFNNSLKKGKKISRSDILPVTQFFTDRYMVKKIVEDSLKNINKTQLYKLKIIDPACGGGNFLTYAFEYLVSIFNLKENEIKNLLETCLIGYDLDYELAGVAKISLFIKFCKYVKTINKIEINVFGGSNEDIKGFFSYGKNKKTFQVFSPYTHKKYNLQRMISSDNIKIILTNPPFMGRRNMGLQLKNYLSNKYNHCNSDLCVSFINHCLQNMNEQDVLGVVTQTSWLFLSSFDSFRDYILNNFTINYCYDLGSDAFKDINGEKTNVALMIITKNKSTSEFYYLKQHNYNQKKEMIEKSKYASHEIFKVDQNDFLKNSKKEILYLLTGRIGKIHKSYDKYGLYATPMQGTSTGDNTKFIDHSWKKSHDKDWILVSKGGGYSKWQGLNYYRVKWGKDASLIKNNPGSAVRNLKIIKKTELVYSDTGTSGLSVRVLLPKQVFIASGPGIKVLRGDIYSHLGFLNSRFASFFLRVLSPKLTISAGYIREIPVNRHILGSKIISKNSAQCVKLKKDKLSTSLPNEEFINIDPSTINNINSVIINKIKLDLKKELSRLKLESDNEDIIFETFNLKESDKKIISDIVGIHSYKIKGQIINKNISEFDKLIAKTLDVNTNFVNGKTSKGLVASEGVIEYLSTKLQINPSVLCDYLLKKANKLTLVKKIYFFDLLHKSILYHLGFKTNYDFNINNISIKKIIKLLFESVPDFQKVGKDISQGEFNLEEWISKRFIKHHKNSFFDKPIITLDKENLRGLN